MGGMYSTERGDLQSCLKSLRSRLDLLFQSSNLGDLSAEELRQTVELESQNNLDDFFRKINSDENPRPEELSDFVNEYHAEVREIINEYLAKGRETRSQRSSDQFKNIEEAIDTFHRRMKSKITVHCGHLSVYSESKIREVAKSAMNNIWDEFVVKFSDPSRFDASEIDYLKLQFDFGVEERIQEYLERNRENGIEYEKVMRKRVQNTYMEIQASFSEKNILCGDMEIHLFKETLLKGKISALQHFQSSWGHYNASLFEKHNQTLEIKLEKLVKELVERRLQHVQATTSDELVQQMNDVYLEDPSPDEIEMNTGDEGTSSNSSSPFVSARSTLTSSNNSNSSNGSDDYEGDESRSSSQMKIISWNCHGHKNLTWFLPYANFYDFILLQETWLVENQRNLLSQFAEYSFVTLDALSSEGESGRPLGGLAILFRKTFENVINVRWFQGVRIHGVEFQTNRGMLLLLNTYFYHSDSSKREHIEKLRSIISHHEGPVIIMGDFNICTYSSSHEHLFTYLREMCQDSECVLADTHQLHHTTATFKHISWLDHSIVPKDLFLEHLVTVKLPSFTTPSDHKPLELFINLSITGVTSQIPEIACDGSTSQNRTTSTIQLEPGNAVDDPILIIQFSEDCITADVSIREDVVENPYMSSLPVVGISSSGNFMCGLDAMNCDCDKRWSLLDLIEKETGPFGVKKIKIGDELLEHDITPQLLFGVFLRSLKNLAETHHRKRFSVAVFIVPLGLSSPLRIVLKDAGVIAGFSDMHLINKESLAAYVQTTQLQNQRGQCSLVVLSEQFGVIFGCLFFYNEFKSRKVCTVSSNCLNISNNRHAQTDENYTRMWKSLTQRKDLYAPALQVVVILVTSSDQWEAVKKFGEKLNQESNVLVRYFNSNNFGEVTLTQETLNKIKSSIEEHIPRGMLRERGLTKCFPTAIRDCTRFPNDSIEVEAPIGNTFYTSTIVTFFQPESYPRRNKKAIIGVIHLEKEDQAYMIPSDSILDMEFGVTEDGIIYLKNVKLKKKNTQEGFEGISIEWETNGVSDIKRDNMKHLVNSIFDGVVITNSSPNA